MEFAKKRSIMQDLKKEENKQKEWKEAVRKAWLEKGPRTTGMAYENFMKTVSERLASSATGRV